MNEQLTAFLRRAIPGPKPIYRSMTVASAVLMVAAYFVAENQGVSPMLEQLIITLGVLAMVVYLRRALVNIYGDRA